MANNRVNPLSGKRYAWEEAQRAKKEAEEPSIAELEQRLSLLKRAQKAQQSREDLISFVEFTMPDPLDPNNVEKSRYEAAPFHKAIARHL